MSETARQSSPPTPQVSEPEPAGTSAVERLLERVDPSVVGPTPGRRPAWPALTVGRAVKVQGEFLWVRSLTGGEPVKALISSEMDPEFLDQVVKQERLVALAAAEDDGLPCAVGVLDGTRLQNLTLRADHVSIEATKDLVLRAGKAAVQLRADGDLELLGTRISAVSRGLMRVVGRLLRLN